MSVSAKIVLRKKPNSRGLYPLAIRITKNRRSTYKLIGHYIDLEYWDSKNSEVKKSHPNSQSLNNLLTSKLSEIRKGIIALQTNNKDASANQIKNEIYKPTSNLTFFDYADEHLEALKSEGKMNRLSTDSAWLSYIKKYYKVKHLTFQEIDERFLMKFKIFLKGNCSLTETTTMNIMVFIRLLYNKAIMDNIVSKELYPFGPGKFKIKFPETIKIGLSEKEIKVIESLDNLSDIESHSLNVWLYSFYFAGMRVSDVLKTRWSQIYDGRLHYRMGKNSKLLSLKIPLKIDKILQEYICNRNNDNDFIFPELKKANLDDPKDLYNKIKTANKKFNKNLKTIALKAGIKKKLTMHIARHTFGHISEDKIPLRALQKLYRHSSITTTINYQSNFIHKAADDALEEVINF
ncbi:site-specific integrase [Tamlana sp. 2_MG-2023]|uniref:site-specific integrase n=1 Tax=unclassified Tamlana TaxID=2614803 RepID=UPI0026E17F50|nr:MULTISPECIES: site-specific integrase [unclassified Tamlana]MDO6761623.1 site-specific integrase [Tamlana sp. 2_MG-2023]MDO6792449.1 site-specific integrase [Tamlana sp. 1_MG-2023]